MKVIKLPRTINKLSKELIKEVVKILPNVLVFFTRLVVIFWVCSFLYKKPIIKLLMICEKRIISP